MKKKALKDSHYLHEITIQCKYYKKKLKLPKQSTYSDSFVKQHGCSLIAEDIVLQWLGVKGYDALN